MWHLNDPEFVNFSTLFEWSRCKQMPRRDDFTCFTLQARNIKEETILSIDNVLSFSYLL